MAIWSSYLLSIRHKIVSEFYGRLYVMMYMNVSTPNDISTINCNERDKQNSEKRVDTKMFWKDALTIYFFTLLSDGLCPLSSVHLQSLCLHVSLA